MDQAGCLCPLYLLLNQLLSYPFLLIPDAVVTHALFIDVLEFHQGLVFIVNLFYGRETWGSIMKYYKGRRSYSKSTMDLLCYLLADWMIRLSKNELELSTRSF